MSTNIGKQEIRPSPRALKFRVQAVTMTSCSLPGAKALRQFDLNGKVVALAKSRVIVEVEAPSKTRPALPTSLSPHTKLMVAYSRNSPPSPIRVWIGIKGAVEEPHLMLYWIACAVRTTLSLLTNLTRSPLPTKRLDLMQERSVAWPPATEPLLSGKRPPDVSGPSINLANIGAHDHTESSFPGQDWLCNTTS